MGQIKSKIKENIYYPFVDDDMFIYNEALIEHKHIQRKDKVVDLYYQIFQYNNRNNCYLSELLEKFLFGLIKKFTIIPNIQLGTTTKINDSKIIIDHIIKIHDTYIGSKFTNMKEIREKIKNKYLDIINDIEDSYNTINEIETDYLDLKSDHIHLVRPKYTILQITQILREMLKMLRCKIKNMRDNDDEYYNETLFNRLISYPIFRKWNYNQFIKNNLTSNITIIDIKILDIDKEIEHLNIIKENFTQLIDNMDNIDIKIRQNFQNQIDANLKKMYTNYRFNRF
jgi:hypothetical protein